MFNIAQYYRNENENYNEIPPHTSQNGHHHKSLQTINDVEGVEKREHFCIAGGNIN